MLNGEGMPDYDNYPGGGNGLLRNGKFLTHGRVSFHLAAHPSEIGHLSSEMGVFRRLGKTIACCDLF